MYSAADVYADVWFRERGLLVDDVDEVHGEMKVPGVVPKLQSTPGSIRSPARWAPGADNQTVFRELGIDEEQLAKMAEDGQSSGVNNRSRPGSA